MDIIKQNRITRKKLRKALKRQAAKRRAIEIESAKRIESLRERLGAVSRANNDCEMLLNMEIKDILDCVNIGEFPKNGHVDFDLGFMKMSFVYGKFMLRSVKLPDKSDFKYKKGA